MAHDPDACTTYVACQTEEMVLLPARLQAQTCFTSSLQGPIQLVELRWNIAATLGDLDDGEGLRLQVFTSDDGPQDEIEALELSAAQHGQVGVNVYKFDPPLNLPEASFCAGIAGGDKTADCGLGVYIDTNADLDLALSYATVDYDNGCEIPNFTELSELLLESDPGWCIEALVQKLPL